MDISNINSTQRSMQDRLPGFPEPPGPLEHYDDSHPVVQENMAVRRGIIEGTSKLPRDEQLVDLIARSTAPVEHLNQLRRTTIEQDLHNPDSPLASVFPPRQLGVGGRTRLAAYTRNSPYWNDPSIRERLKVGVMTHELSHVNQFSNSGNYEHVSTPHSVRSPYLEGYAEGYALRHTPKERVEIKSLGKSYEGGHSTSYGPSDFKHHDYGPDLFLEAQSHAYESGDPGSISEVEDAHRYAGVLSSENNPLENPSKEEIADATHQYLINNIQKKRGLSAEERDYENEVNARKIAVHGQTIQGSMFPDIVPETNQFGSAPFLGPADVSRSSVGLTLQESKKRATEAAFERLRNMES